MEVRTWGFRAAAAVGEAALLMLFALATGTASAKKKPAKLGLVATAAAATTSTAPSTPVTATATCPGKRKAVAGGWSSSLGGGGAQVLPYSSLMTPDQKGWTIIGFANAAGQTLTTYVYCRKVPKAIVAVSAAAATPAGSTAQATTSASCTGKRRLLGGGFASGVGASADELALPLASLASGPQTWTYTAANNDALAHPISVHAYCSKGIKPARAVTATRSPTVPQFTETTTVAAGCSGKRRRAFGGGFANSPFGPLGINPAPVARENHLSGQSWTVTVRNQVFTGTITSTAQVLCGQK